MVEIDPAEIKGSQNKPFDHIMINICCAVQYPASREVKQVSC